MVVHEAFEVLYSPVKAFKKIVEKPDFKGILVILVLTMFLMVVAQYATASKLFLEKGTPDEDEWTESVAIWTFNKNGVGSNDADRVVGNYSVKCFVPNGTSVWMKTTGIGQFNCSEDNGYRGLSFRIKWIHQNETPPSSSATLQLFSGSEDDYFEFDMIDLISNSSDKWANITVDTGPDRGWIRFGFPDWGNITRLKFELDWVDSDVANLTMKIDDPYFGKYVSFLSRGFFNEIFIISSLMGATTDFLISWILYAILLWLIIKISRGETGPLRILFIVLGYTFSIRMFCFAVEAFLIPWLPSLNFPLKAWSPVAGEEGIARELTYQIYENNWYSTLTGKILLGIDVFLFGNLLSLVFAYQIIGAIIALTFAFHAWKIGLSATAISSLRGFTWSKAGALSGVSYVLYLLIRSFVPI